MGESLKVKYLIVGGGLCAASAAAGIREVDHSGSVLIVCGERHLPYDRPPLSKNFLHYQPADPADIESKDPSFYKEKNVSLKIGVKAERIDRGSKTVDLSDGSTVSYEKLLLATGCSPIALPVEGSNLRGVHLLRTVDDSESIRHAIANSKSAVMVGAGYIGMEVGASCQSKDVATSIVAIDKYPWSKFASPALGDFLQRYFEGKGVKFELGQEVAGFEGSGKLEAVRTKDGSRIPAEFAVIGIGVRQNTQIAKDAGLEVDPKEGVLVDETLRTADPSIWAAGDIAAFQDKELGKCWHAEHYMNAKWQGDRVGKNMAGEVAPYDQVPYFFSDMFDLSMVLRGDPKVGKSVKTIGDMPSAEFVELYADGSGRLEMGIAFGRDFDKLEKISDKLEGLLRQKVSADSVDAESIGF